MGPWEPVERVRVSICGARNRADVEAVAGGGADAVGVIVLPRHVAEDAVSLEAARDLLMAVPPYLGRYAVTHAVDLADLLRVAELPIDTLQLHDDVAPNTVRDLRTARPDLRLIKALHVVPGEEEPDPARWVSLVHAVMFDSADFANDRIGGTGQVHDWEVSRRLASTSQLPVVLAGGLTPGNVAEAISTVRPWGVNLNSGAESAGFKDAELVRAFVRAVSLGTAATTA